MRCKIADAVVKIDEKLLKEIERLIENYRYRYSSKKQVVNLAIIEFLNANFVNSSKSGDNKRAKKDKNRRGKK